MSLYPNQGYRCECRLLDLSDVPRALTNRDTRDGVKLVAEADTGRVAVTWVVLDDGDFALIRTGT